MPRRTRRHGASGGHSTKRPVTIPAERRQEIEAVLDRVVAGVLGTEADTIQESMATLLEDATTSAEVLVQTCIDGNEHGPAILISLLPYLVPEDWERHVTRIERSTNAPDAVRFEARRLLGWDPTNPARDRRRFFKTLRDPAGMLSDAMQAASALWPMRLEIISEVAASLEALAEREQHAALERIINDAGWSSIPLLHGLVYADDPTIQWRAADALAEFRFAGSIGPLWRLLRSTNDDDLRQHIEDILATVTFDVVSGPEGDEATFGRQALPPLAWVKLSSVSPEGVQEAWIAREAAPGFLSVVGMTVQAEIGLVGLTFDGPISEAIVDADILLSDDGIERWVDVDLAVARGLLDAGVETYIRAQPDPLPFILELYEPLLHDAYPPAPDEQSIVPELDDTAYHERDDLAGGWEKMLDHRLFDLWLFSPETVMERLALHFTALGIEPTGEEDIPLGVSLLGPEQQADLRASLRRQAWLLDRDGNSEERDTALALAAWLIEASEEDLEASPFLQSLADESIALTAELLSDELEAGDLDDDEEWLDGLENPDNIIDLFGPMEKPPGSDLKPWNR